MSTSDLPGNGPLWVKAVSSVEALEVIEANHHAYVLATVIALRANYREGFNAKGLRPGEALLGDHARYGMTRKEYRTALDLLVRAGFAATRRTNRGTIAWLCDARLFVVPCLTNGQPTGHLAGQREGHQGANSGPSRGHQGATNKDVQDVETKRERIARAREGSGDLPTKEEVQTYGSLVGVPPDTCARFFDHHQGNSLWRNQHDRLIDWKHKLLIWRDRDRANGGPSRRDPYGTNPRNAAMGVDEERRSREICHAIAISTRLQDEADAREAREAAEAAQRNEPGDPDQ
ncbi:MAG: hypothetical protein H7A46_19415 [Verrucomicrobiales bacterium]|nr:hypothetical protein [Verrucomicrobiales bacterium]